MKRFEYPLARCPFDEWDFDPRYTKGVCPICGWRPEGAPDSPRWLATMGEIPLDLIFLAILGGVFIIAGFLVITAGR